MNNLSQYTDEQLREELKRRAAERKSQKEKVDRCRHCTHWGEITYLGQEIPEERLRIYGGSKYCRFFRTKSEKYYRAHSGSQLACEHFERQKKAEALPTDICPG